MELRVKRINNQARLPLYQHKGDAGLDLFSCIDLVLGPGEVKPISTGIKLAVPEGYVGLVWDKSGISLKGVQRLAGVIDAGYRGEVQVVMANLGREPFVITAGMKIAQLLVQPVETVAVTEVEELDDTSRGEKGFGSTGMY
jgi:dUTP pyrophosphatase